MKTEGAIEEDIGLVLTVSALEFCCNSYSLCILLRKKPSTMLSLLNSRGHSPLKGQKR